MFRYMYTIFKYIFVHIIIELPGSFRFSQSCWEKFLMCCLCTSIYEYIAKSWDLSTSIIPSIPYTQLCFFLRLYFKHILLLFNFTQSPIFSECFFSLTLESRFQLHNFNSFSILYRLMNTNFLYNFTN